MEVSWSAVERAAQDGIRSTKAAQGEDLERFIAKAIVAALKEYDKQARKGN